MLAVAQGFLGAAPAGSKRKLEAAVGDGRYFDASLATAANVFLNFVVYPIVIGALAVSSGRAGLFTQAMAKWVFLGLTLASLEAAFRLRESFFRGQPLAIDAAPRRDLRALRRAHRRDRQPPGRPPRHDERRRVRRLLCRA
jgi:hypothetical protein